MDNRKHIIKILIIVFIVLLFVVYNYFYYEENIEFINKNEGFIDNIKYFSISILFFIKLYFNEILNILQLIFLIKLYKKIAKF